MAKWAYKAVFISVHGADKKPVGLPDASRSMAKWQDEMNRHGVQGWEAFALIEKPNGTWVFFKTANPD